MPPSRVRYASYYHLWTTIIRNDRPALVGAANRRQDASDVCAASAFEEFRRDPNGRYRVVETIKSLLRQTRARRASQPRMVPVAISIARSTASPAQRLDRRAAR